MSSIYQKGRDGYYYYQAYVYNPKSKKKDKRIFYALGTKDFEKAKAKQRELDLQHSKKIYERKSYFTSNGKYRTKHLTIIFSVTIASIILFNYFFIENDIEDQPYKQLIEVKENISKQNTRLEFKSDETDKSKNEANIMEIYSKPISEDPKVVIPKYVIERVEKLSGSFEQGKLYVSIDENSSSESQLLLCNKLKDRFEEFSNIVICLYANNFIGKNLAKGDDENISLNEKKRYWLAMYSYNPVEGEYFDNNPSDYLGVY